MHTGLLLLCPFPVLRMPARVLPNTWLGIAWDPPADRFPPPWIALFSALHAPGPSLYLSFKVLGSQDPKHLFSAYVDPEGAYLSPYIQGKQAVLGL